MARLSALARLGQAGSLRGIDEGDSPLPVSAAVVIGLGGSGIQTITRVRAAIRAERPDQAAIEAVRFLGIDAVDLGDQNPPLPPGVDLGVGEFFNLVESPFDASSYIRAQLPSDEFLQQWWDPDYHPPMGPLTEGLKRERMLGRLAFHRVGDGLTSRIQAAITEAVKIDEGHIGRGAQGPDVPTIPVYIVNSASGGTGSSGFLSVVFATWTAARARGYYPEIRCITYLPSVFRGVVLRTPGGQIAARAHDANAYAYFREIDHFCRHSSQLGRYLGRPIEAGGPEIADNQLLKQVYLIGSTMRGVGEITKVEDLFEIAAEAIYGFLLTEAGRPLVGVDATNTDRALAETDRFGKPRRYCSLGIARVVFPGETYRRHLSMRYIDWFITDGLLKRPDELRSLVRNHGDLHSLTDMVTRTDASARSIDAEDEVLDFLDIAEFGMPELERTADPGTAQSLIAQVERRSPGAIRSIRDTASARNRLLLGEFEDAITTTVFRTGYGIPFSKEMLQVLAKRLGEIVSGAEGELQLTSGGRVDAEARVHELLKELQTAHNRNMYQKVVSKLGSYVGKGRTVEVIATALGQAIQSWAQAIYDSELADARADLARQMADRLDTLRFELERAVETLHLMVEDARRMWTDDTLIGKDAGPAATTSLLPTDAHPEIEESSLATALFEDVQREHANKLSGEELERFIARWVAEEANRSFFSLGSSRESEQAAAERSLSEALLRDARRRALDTGSDEQRRPRLPADLKEAVEHQPEDLENAVDGLLILSRSVCWSWEEGRFQLDAPEEGTRAQGVRPSVTSAIAHHRTVEDLVEAAADDRTKPVEMPDPERIVALSVEWAVPMHAVHDIDTWKASYDLLERRRSRHPDRNPPSHIDHRFTEVLGPLVPEYFDREETAQMVGKALVFGSLVRQEDRAVLERYDHSRSNPPVAPLRWEADGRCRGRIIRIHDGRLKAEDTDIDLGDDWEDVIKRLGSNGSLRHSIEELGIWMAHELGAAYVNEQVGNYLQNDLEALIDDTQTRPREAEVLTLVFDELAVWQTELNLLHLAG